MLGLLPPVRGRTVRSSPEPITRSRVARGRTTVPMLACALLSLTLSPSGEARAQPPHEREEARRLSDEIVSGARLARTRAAISVRHLVKRQPRLNLLAASEPRWWQVVLSPAIPRLITMLSDGSRLEWVSQTGETEQITSPRQEALLALEALGRPAVDPLIAALDEPKLGPRADEALRLILDDGPGDAKRSSWQAFWNERRTRPLPDERGLWPWVLQALALLALGIAVVVWRQRRAAAR